MYRLFVLLLVLGASVSGASWQKIAQLDAKATCCFFLDDMTGLAGSGDYNGTDVLKIWRTNDGGITWLPCGVPVGSGQVTSIRMQTALIGHASIFSTSNTRFSLWKTTDGGYSWFDDSRGNFGYTVDVWATSKAITKTKWAGPSSWLPGGSSIDGGNTFSGTFFDDVVENSNGLYFTSDSIGVATAGPMVGVSWYTTDGGVNWTKGGQQAESWSAWGFANTQVFFAIAELERKLVWSTNSGRSWMPRYDFGALLTNNAITTGHISGKGSVMYVQTYAGGMFRTSGNDSGRTWRAVGGPSNIVDSRAFYVGGCGGELVIAFDDQGGVWKTTDGGDGILDKANPLSLSHIMFPQISACSTFSFFGTLAFGDCGEFIITSATLENNSNGVFTFTPIVVPDTLQTGGIDTFFVSFDPSGNPATYSARIRIKGELHQAGNIIKIDSVIRITASASAVLPKLTASTNVVSFGELSVCNETRDTIITLKNEGCDTLTITNGPTPAGLPFTISTIPLPFSLPPDSTVTFTISYDPEAGGAFNTSTRIQATSQGRQQQIEIVLDASARWGEGVPVQSMAALQFPTISICATDSLAGFITNTGCDTLIIDSTLLSGDADFSIINSILSGQKLRPGDTIWFTFHLKPTLKGSRSGTFTIFLHNEHGVFPGMTGQFSLIGNVLDGTRMASQSLTSLDFGPTDLCSERDSVFTIRNTGCDTIVVTPALQGTGFELEGMTMTLAPGESQTIIVRTKVDTAGGASQSVGLITFSTNATNGLTPIQLKRDYQYPRYYGVNFRAGQSQGSSGDIVVFEIVGENGLGMPGSGIHTLEATLDVNEDLLFYLYARGPNTVTRNGDRFTITHPVELQATPGNALAELYYEVYLTKDTIADINISDFVFNGGDTSPCPLRFLTDGTLGNATPTFSYVFNCGDRTLHKFLEGTSVFSSISIRPNPAREEVTLEVAATTVVPAVIDIYNAFGVKVTSRTIMVSGSTKIPIDLRGLSNGQYFVRVVGVGASPVVSFIKQ